MKKESIFTYNLEAEMEKEDDLYQSQGEKIINLKENLYQLNGDLHG